MLQNILNKINASDVKAEHKKKYCESPLIPTVPGPAESAKIFIKENAPLMTPKPRPETISFLNNSKIDII